MSRHGKQQLQNIAELIRESPVAPKPISLVSAEITGPVAGRVYCRDCRWFTENISNPITADIKGVCHVDSAGRTVSAGYWCKLGEI